MPIPRQPYPQEEHRKQKPPVWEDTQGDPPTLSVAMEAGVAAVGHGVAVLPKTENGVTV